MEHEFHRGLTIQTVSDSGQADILIELGDDATILKGSDDSTVISTDTVAEGLTLIWGNVLWS